jgi:hypothetical protein
MTDLLERQEERTERKRFDAIWWGGAFLWIGMALAGDYLDILPRIDGEWWPWIFIGIGPWALMLNGYRLASATAPNPTTWDWIWTVIFMAIRAMPIQRKAPPHQIPDSHRPGIEPLSL